MIEMSPKSPLSSHRVLLLALVLSLASAWFSPAMAQSGPPAIHAVMNVASYADESVSAGEMIVIFGTNLGPDRLTHLKVGGDGKLVNSLEGVQLFASGIPCPLIYVSKYQLSAMVPYGVARSPFARFQVVVNGVLSNLWDMPVSPSMPGIFTADASGKGQAAMTNFDGSYNSAARRANRGTWITFYLTGEGPLNVGGVDGRLIWGVTSLTLPVKVRIAGYEAEVLYAGSAPGNVNGFAQINALVPANLPYGGDLPLTVEIGGVQSRQEVTVSVAGPQAPKPAAPAAATANLVGNDMIRLAWNGVGPKASRYLIERSDDGGGFRQVAEASGTDSTFEDVALGDGSNFKYRIQAFNEWGVSAYSDVVQVNSTAPSLAAPSALKANGPTDTTVALSWVNKGSGATEIAIEKSSAGSKVYTEVMRIPVTNAYVLTGLTPSTRQSFRIRAIGPSGISRYSNTSSTTTLASATPPPPAPIVKVSLSPATASLRDGQTQQFVAAVEGSANTAVTWSISPSVGSMSAGGLYAAPASITQAQSVTVSARSIADPSKIATAIVNLVPPEVILLSINPASANVQAGNAQPLAAQISGNANAQLTWKLTPSFGTLSPSGSNAVYYAPASVPSQQLVEVEVRSVANPSVFATSRLTVQPPPPEVSVTVSPATASLRGGEAQQFSAMVTGTANSAVEWTISPSVGTISASGRYVAPSSVSTLQIITVIARSLADTTKTATALVTLSPPEVISLSISPSTATVKAGQSQSFAVQLNGTAGSPLTWTLTPNVGTLTANGLSATYSAPASVAAQQAVQVQVRSVANPNASAAATVTLTADAPADPNLRSFWPPQTVPTVQAVTTDTKSVTLGLRFTSDVPGKVVGIRFFKGSSNTGSHVGTLWSSTGANLGQVSFVGESGSGWQQANFAAPISIAANTAYIASYFAPSGNYAEEQFYAWQNLNSAPLHVPAGGSGVYAYGSAAAFPNTAWNNSNYWVDVVFLPDAGTPPPATYSISGRVSGSSATLSLSGPSTGTATTNASGDYTFTGLSNGLYVVSPSRTGYSFSPSSTSATIASASVSGINFTGTALPPDSRSIVLSWNSSPSSNVVGYNIYRAMSSAGPYSKITSAPVAATTYTDTNVSTGNTYYYYATAVDSGGIEGAYSNQASASLN